MRVATDIGGTFTDLVALNDNGELLTLKGDTTPPNFEEGVVTLLKKSGVSPAEISAFIHGTTTIINALTERKGAKTALITTKGFRDVLEIARSNRPDLFNLVFKKPVPFVPRYLRYEVEERVSSEGEVITPLNRADIEKAVSALKKEGAEAIAICYINSYANDAHEQTTAEYIRQLWPEAIVTTSGQVTREWREYERSSTIVLNAYVAPVAASYIDHLENHLTHSGVSGDKYIMQSNGGLTTFAGAKVAPINMVESGPVAGVFGTAVLGQAIGERDLIAFDVGGTTAKCSLIDGGEVKIITDYRIERTERSAGYPIMAPVVDIVEIGNGGGSIAWVDESGSLRVGPQSAGAKPGPVAYGRGGSLPTTTDACLIAGRLSPDNFEGGVDIAAVEEALLRQVGKPLGLSAKEAAVSVIRVAEANMYNALKLVSVRRGYDPRDFALVAFGGGGPMHAAGLAREFQIKRTVIPTCASVFAAWGMLMTDIRHDYIQTRISQVSTAKLAELNSLWVDLLQEASEELSRQGIAEGAIVYNYYADMRYTGQEHTVKVPLPSAPWNDAVTAEIIERFHRAHEQTYTFRLNETPVEIVNLHLAAYGRMEKPGLREIAAQSLPVESAITGHRLVYFSGGGWLDAPVYAREKLLYGATLNGPAIVEERSASCLLEPSQHLHVDQYGNLIIEAEDE